MCRGDIERLVRREVGLGELAGTVSRTLRKAVPFEGTCLLTLDPATLLPRGSSTDNVLPPPASRRMGELELTEPDFNKFAELAHAEIPAASLSGATRRRPRAQPASALGAPPEWFRRRAVCGAHRSDR